MAAGTRIEEQWAAWSGSIVSFGKRLDRKGIEFLSYSKISTVESCEYRYFLEYVEGVRLDPVPMYFRKGTAFHSAAASVYRARAAGRRPRRDRIRASIDKKLPEEDGLHVHNAVDTLLDNLHEDWEVVGVEAPFVLTLGPALPPLLGIVDLVLRKGATHAVVDHKTGKKFYEADPLQLAIYREHIRREHGATRYLAFFDSYRWVNSLKRIRKPAFERTKVEGKELVWPRAKRRIASAHRAMTRISRGGRAGAADECFACPHRDECPERSAGSGWY